MSIGRHTAFNIFGAVMPLAISLVTIPIYLNLIGEARYGILAIVWLLLGYFGFFDLGLGRATAQRIGSLRLGTVNQRATAFWTALIVNLGLGFLGGLIIWPVAYYVFGHAVSVDANLRPEIIAVVPWLALLLPFATFSGVLSGALTGRERFLELNAISIIGAALFQVLPLIAAIYWGPDLRVIIPTVLLARVLTLAALFNRCLRHVCPGHSIVFEKGEAIRLLKFGGWVTVSSIVGPLMVILDRIVIGIVSGAAAVTLYTVPFQLANRTAIIPQSLANALFPRLSSLDDVVRAEKAHEGQRALIAIMTPISAIGILLIEPFLTVWISPDFGRNAAMVGIIILTGFWVNAFAIVPFAVLQARGRPDMVAKVHMAELPPYLIMLYFGLVFGGLPGAALAFLIRNAADTLLLCWLAGLFRASILSLMIPSLTICSATLVATALDPGSPVWFGSSAALLAFAAFHSWKTAPSSVRSMVLNLASRVARKK